MSRGALAEAVHEPDAAGIGGGMRVLQVLLFSHDGREIGDEASDVIGCAIQQVSQRSSALWCRGRDRNEGQHDQQAARELHRT